MCEYKIHTNEIYNILFIKEDTIALLNLTFNDTAMIIKFKKRLNVFK